MDHKEQHHLKHVKEREHEKKEHQEHQRATMRSTLPFHPAWLVVVGVILVVLAVLIWTVFLT